MQTSVATQAETPSTAPARPKPLPSVSALLVKLILVCLLPPAFGAGLWLYIDYQTTSAELKDKAIQAARAKVQTVDAELAKAEFFAQALASSELLVRPDFAAFHQRSVQLLRESNIDLRVSLYGIDGQQLVNTNIPYGQPLGRRQDLKDIESVIATGRMAPQRLAFRVSDGRPVVLTMAPVYHDKKVAYVLAVGFSPDRFNTILSQLDLGTGLVASIIDSNGTIAARTLDSGKLIGQKSHPEIMESKQIDKKLEAIVETHSREGVPLFAAYSSSPNTGWGVVIGIPRLTFTAPLRQTFIVFGLSVTLVLLLSLGLAGLVGSRIARSVRSLNAAAVAFGTDAAVELPAATLAETDELSQALQTSARLLTRRTQQLQTANETLQERSAELSDAQHIAKIGNWKWQASTGAFFASDELLLLYGQKILLPFNAQMGTTFPDAAWQELKAAAKATLQSKTGFSLVLPTLTEVKTQLWARVNGEIVHNATGDVTGLRGTLQDIDVFTKAELALKDSESRLSMALANSDLVLWDWDINTDDLFFDDRWHTMGDVLPPEKYPNTLKGFMASVYLEDVQIIKTALERYFRGETSKYEASYRVHHKDGHLIWVQASGKVVERDAAGMPVRMLGVASDASKRKRHEIEIAHLQTEMEDLLVWQVAQHTVAALAHEVNQPLASASILCEAADRMLRAEGLSEEAKGKQTEKLLRTLKSISSETERAGAVLRKLVRSVTQSDITRAPTPANEVVAESIQTAREEGVFDYTINTSYAANLPAIMANSLQVNKVLLNLLHNGAQAMYGAHITNGKLLVSTALVADGREVCISVRDEGPGIGADMQQEVFQPFITTKLHGLGMGLTISRALIEANGGKLWHTPNDGPGTTFHFTLPISG